MRATRRVAPTEGRAGVTEKRKSLKDEIADAVWRAREYDGPTYEAWCHKVAVDVVKIVRERIAGCLNG